MKTTLIIHDDYIEVLQDGYNIIQKTIYDNEVVVQARKLIRMMEPLDERIK